MANPNEIVKACRELLGVVSNANNCNDFVIAVAARFGVALEGAADRIVARITSDAGWTQHGTNGNAASQAADRGALVVGGMASRELGDAHGHVVIVVAGVPNRDKYPVAYWGSMNQRIRPDGALGKTVNFSFSEVDRDRVVYASQMV